MMHVLGECLESLPYFPFAFAVVFGFAFAGVGTGAGAGSGSLPSSGNSENRFAISVITARFFSADTSCRRLRRGVTTDIKYLPSSLCMSSEATSALKSEWSRIISSGVWGAG